MNDNHIKHQSGYTLFELIIVISLFSIILLIVIPSYHSLSQKHKTDHFFEQLQEDIYYTQMIALSRGKPMMLDFITTLSQYRILVHNQTIVKREYPHDIIVERGTLETKIEFNPNGNIRKAGTIFIKTDKGKYKMTFQLGKGRFEIAKM